MEQKDYLQREIEKIGIVLRAIFNFLSGKPLYEDFSFEKRFEETKEKFLNELNFDVNAFIQMNETDSQAYISQFKGFNHENIELLADIIHQFGIDCNGEEQKIYYSKSLQLYKLCSFVDKTFSIQREAKMDDLKKQLGI